jgi:hypothetical protein
MRRKLAVLGALGVLGAWLAASSGHGAAVRTSSNSVTTPAPATDPARKAAFIAAADTVCRDLGAQAAAAAPTGTDLPSYASGLAALGAVLARERAELGALVAPPDGRAMFAAYLAFLDREISSASHARAAAAAGDRQGFTAAMEGLLTGQEQPGGALPPEMVAAGAYGLTDCR